MSMFRKPRKTIQRRVFSTVDDEDDLKEVEDAPITPVDMAPMEIDELITEKEVKTKVKNKSEKKENKGNPKDKKLLSFEDEEEEECEVFKVKKSSHSKKYIRMLDKERKKKRKDNQSADNVLSDVKDANNGVIKTIQTDDLVIVLKNTESSIILNGQGALTAGKDDLTDDEEDTPQHRFSHPDAVKRVLEKGNIPDAAMIYAARKRRQEYRDMGEYVSINEPQSVTGKAKGRLVREDGDGDGSDEDPDRVDMTVHTKVREQEERTEKFYEAESLLYDKDSDPELTEWENQQIRKGVTGAQIVAAQQEGFFNFLSNPSYDYDKLSSTSLLNQAYATAGIAPLCPAYPATSVDLDPLQAVTERLAILKSAHQKHSEDLERVTEELDKLRSEKEEFDENLPEVKRRFKFFREMRGYVTDLVECLDEKVPEIVSSEQRALAATAKQTAELVERRRQDLRDQACAEQSTSRNVVDEQRVRRGTEREGRRTRRRRVREKIGAQKNHVEGMSSDDEIPDQQLLAYNTEIDQIRSAAKLVFADALDEFGSVEGVLIRFQKWLKLDHRTYNESYVSLSLPKILGPFIRLELVDWNPFKNGTEIEKMKWYNTLALYGLNPDITEADMTVSPDALIIPNIIEKVILPKVTDIIEQCWDPMSTNQTLKLVTTVTRLVKEYPIHSTKKSMVVLFEALHDKIKSTIENDVFIPILAQQTQFFQRQFASGIKLLRNILFFRGVLNDNALMDLAFVTLLNRSLLAGLRICKTNEAVQKALLITNTFPRVWLQNSIPPQLEMFAGCVKHLVKQLDESNPLHKELIETTSTILVTLHTSA